MCLEVNLYIDAPPGISSASQLKCNIEPTKLQLGLKNANRWFINESTFSKVNVDDSSWYLDKDENIIHIVLSKVFKGETWESVLCNNFDLDPMTKQDIQKQMMLERFQQENPGFDFRNAEFNGAPPDPRTFMGGVRYD